MIGLVDGLGELRLKVAVKGPEHQEHVVQRLLETDVGLSTFGLHAPEVQKLDKKMSRCWWE